MSLQKIKLINKIEKLTDGVESNKKLHHAKQELLYQIKTLDIAFTCQGFFKIDRAFLAEVGLSRRGDLVAIGISILKNCFLSLLLFQMASAWCTYIVITIQASSIGLKTNNELN